CRKYGETLPDVLAYAQEIRGRLTALGDYDARAAALQHERDDVDRAIAEAERAVRETRSRAAPDLAAAIEGHLQELALGGARFDVVVGGEGAGDDVTFLLAANA